MAGTIELRGFMGLSEVLLERFGASPFVFPLNGVVSGPELINQLGISNEKVEILFINGKATIPTEAMIHPGDRVALVPPGTPGPYRVLLGFKRG